MSTARTRVFKSGNSQAVRLPKGFSYGDGVELEISRDGDVTTLRPAKTDFHRMLEELRKMPKPSTPIERPPFEAPDRYGDGFGED